MKKVIGGYNLQGKFFEFPEDAAQYDEEKGHLILNDPSALAFGEEHFSISNEIVEETADTVIVRFNA